VPETSAMNAVSPFRTLSRCDKRTPCSIGGRAISEAPARLAADMLGPKTLSAGPLGRWGTPVLGPGGRRNGAGHRGTRGFIRRFPRGQIVDPSQIRFLQ
jgi:hypothetical protein